MKIYLNSPKESWVVDRFINEWKLSNPNLTTKFISRSDIVWVISPWTWKSLSKRYLNSKKVICTIHHIDKIKFDADDFLELDKYVDKYHIISTKTAGTLAEITEKPFFYAPFWIDEKKFYTIDNKEEVRKKYNFLDEQYLVGSFQRDTEGHDNLSPKLEKGPDNFIKIVQNFNSTIENLHVVLTGKRRDFVINKLQELDISYSYFPMIDTVALNELYNCLNLYIVSSRVEGGPQSIVECAITKTPIISTDVGIASEILANESIFKMENFSNAIPNIDIPYQNVIKYKIPMGFEVFINEFKALYEN